MKQPRIATCSLFLRPPGSTATRCLGSPPFSDARNGRALRQTKTNRPSQGTGSQSYYGRERGRVQAEGGRRGKRGAWPEGYPITHNYFFSFFGFGHTSTYRKIPLFFCRSLPFAELWGHREVMEVVVVVVAAVVVNCCTCWYSHDVVVGSGRVVW